MSQKNLSCPPHPPPSLPLSSATNRDVLAPPGALRFSRRRSRSSNRTFSASSCARSIAMLTSATSRMLMPTARWPEQRTSGTPHWRKLFSKPHPDALCCPLRSDRAGRWCVWPRPDEIPRVSAQPCRGLYCNLCGNHLRAIAAEGQLRRPAFPFTLTALSCLPTVIDRASRSRWRQRSVPGGASLDSGQDGWEERCEAATNCMERGKSGNG